MAEQPSMFTTLWRDATGALKEMVTAGAQAPPEVIERRELASRIVRMIRNDFADLVDENLRAIFAKENFEHLRLHIHAHTNILGRVVEETCLAYQEPATRYLKGLSLDAARSTVSGQLGELLRLTDQELAALEGNDASGGGSPTPAGAAAEEPGPGGAPEPQDAGDASRGEEGRAADAFEEYLEEADIDTVMDEVQRLGRVLPVLWLFPLVRVRDDGSVGLDFDVYTPANATVETDHSNPTLATAFVTWVDVEERGERRRFYYRWTATTIEKLNEERKPVRDGDPIVGDGINHLGRLPVTACRLGKATDCYYLDGKGGDLYDATLEVCVLRTLQNARFRDSSFKQLLIDGRPEDVPADQVMGNPAIPIYVSEGTAQVLDLQTNLEQLSGVVKERLLDIARAYGISPSSWTMSEKAQSGFSKKMDLAKVLALNLKDRKWLARIERDLYRLVAIGVTAGVYNIPALAGLDPEAQYVVDFTDPRFEEEPKAQAEADARDVVIGKLSVLDLIMRDNPDLTEHEALALLARNRLINERFGGIAGAKAKGASVLEILAGTKQAELAFERAAAAGRGAPAKAAGAVTAPDGGTPNAG